jgi:hypothetical protein
MSEREFLFFDENPEVGFENERKFLPGYFSFSFPRAFPISSRDFSPMGYDIILLYERNRD